MAIAPTSLQQHQQHQSGEESSSCYLFHVASKSLSVCVRVGSLWISVCLIVWLLCVYDLRWGGGGWTSKAAFYLLVIIVVDNLIVGRLDGVSQERFFLSATPSANTPPSHCRVWSLLSHLKWFHKTDYADDESITFQLLLVQDAKMKLDENIIVGDILRFSFITGMEWVTQWWGLQSLNQLCAKPGCGGCAVC